MTAVTEAGPESAANDGAVSRKGALDLAIAFSLAKGKSREEMRDIILKSDPATADLANAREMLAEMDNLVDSLRSENAALQAECAQWKYAHEAISALSRDYLASNKTLRDDNTEMRSRIQAAKKRLRDAKGIHSDWYDGHTKGQETKIINDMEQIVYSAVCYLDGVDGPNRRQAHAAQPVDAEDG